MANQHQKIPDSFKLKVIGDVLKNGLSKEQATQPSNAEPEHCNQGLDMTSMLETLPHRTSISKRRNETGSVVWAGPLDTKMCKLGSLALLTSHCLSFLCFHSTRLSESMHRKLPESSCVEQRVNARENVKLEREVWNA